ALPIYGDVLVVFLAGDLDQGLADLRVHDPDDLAALAVQPVDALGDDALAELRDRLFRLRGSLGVPPAAAHPAGGRRRPVRSPAAAVARLRSGVLLGLQLVERR